ncbi:hypothetical protein T439DRAFT_225287 [Meredithblackwellia eburnea MCA 4105]
MITSSSFLPSKSISIPLHHLLSHISHHHPPTRILALIRLIIAPLLVIKLPPDQPARRADRPAQTRAPVPPSPASEVLHPTPRATRVTEEGDARLYRQFKDAFWGGE